MISEISFQRSYTMLLTVAVNFQVSQVKMFEIEWVEIVCTVESSFLYASNLIQYELVAGPRIDFPDSRPNFLNEALFLFA